MNDQAIRFRIGIFVLASLILLAVLITLFGGFPDFFKTKNTYTFLFDDARGISAGAPVFKSGVKVGQVQSLVLTPKGKVEIVVALDEAYPLRKNDVPTLDRALLGGDSTILLNPDPENGDVAVIAPGAVVPGSIPTDANALIRKTGDLVSPAQEALVEMGKTFAQTNKILERIDKQSFNRLEIVVKKVEGMLDEIQGGVKSAREGLPDVKKTLDEMQDVAKAMKTVIPDARKALQEFQMTAMTYGKLGERADVMLQMYEPKLAKTLDNLEMATTSANKLLSEDNRQNVADILKNTKNASQDFESLAKQGRESMQNLDKALKPLAERGPAIAKNLEEGTDKFNKFLADGRELIQLIGRAEGTVSKLLTDPALYNNLNDSATAVTKILPRLDRVMRDVEIFADKIARHPELLGVGGAVRPASGLK